MRMKKLRDGLRGYRGGVVIDGVVVVVEARVGLLRFHTLVVIDGIVVVVEARVGLLRFHTLVAIGIGEEHESREVEGAEEGEEPEVVVVAGAVNVVGLDPGASAVPGGGPVDGHLDEGAREVAEAVAAEVEGHAEAAHGVGHLK